MLVAAIQSDYTIAPAEKDAPALPEGGALVRLTGCGLCGSDLEKFVHRKSPEGAVLGHEVVGIIESLSNGHGTGFRVGDRIVAAHHTPCGHCHYCRFGSESMCRTFKQSNLTPGGFSQVIALSGEHLHKTVFKIPDPVSDAAASGIEPLACVLKAIDRLDLQAGQSVLLIGLGFIGLLAAQAFRHRGVTVIGSDLATERLELAIRQGWLDADAAVSARQNPDSTLPETIATHTPLGKVDAVFFTVVTSGTLETGFAHVRDGGKCLLFANGAEAATLSPSDLYLREISVVSSYSPSLRHLKEAAELIFSRRIQIEPLITHRFPLSQIAEAMALYQSGNAIKVLITP